VPDWTIFTHGAPHGETIEQVTARADRIITRVLPYLQRGPVVVFSHGHMSRVLGTRWIGLPVVDGTKLKLGTAAPSLLGAQYGSPAIMHWNIPNPAGTRVQQ
jgi:probable phosphoglycerate mutase